MRKDCKKLFAIILASLTASGCSTIKIKDYEMYGDMGRFGAAKVHTLFTEIPPERIYQPAWDDLRIGMICSPANNIADIQATVDKLCVENPGKCDYEKMQNFRASLKSLQEMQESVMVSR